MARGRISNFLLMVVGKLSDLNTDMSFLMKSFLLFRMLAKELCIAALAREPAAELSTFVRASALNVA